MSYPVTRRLLAKVGNGHDEQVKQWQHALATTITTTESHNQVSC